MFRIFYISTLLFLLSVGQSFPQKADWHKDIKNDLYNCDLILAKTKLDNKTNQDPSNPYLIRLINHYDFLQLFFFENDSRKELWLNEAEDRIKTIQNSNCNDADKLFLISESNLQACLLFMTSGNEMKAVSCFRQSFDAYKSLEKLKPNSNETIKLKGLFNIMIGSIPEKYNWLVSVLGMEGNFELGIQYLKQAYKSADNPGDFYELAFYYGMFAAGFTDDLSTTYNEFKAFSEEQKKNPLIRQAISLMAEANGQASSCITFLKTYYHFQGDTYLALLDFQMGKFLLYDLNPEAGSYLIKYINHTKDEGLTLNAHRNLYWHYLITNQKEKANSERETTLNIARSLNTPQASYISSELNADNPPDITLLKARLLYNGGNYQKAANTLRQFDITTNCSRQLCEYHYRKASIEDKLNQHKSALSDYKKAVATGKEKDWYFAPRSALNAGIIYEKQGNTSLAADYYKLSIKINKSHYKESINQEAKNRLKKLRKQG